MMKNFTISMFRVPASLANRTIHVQIDITGVNGPPSLFGTDASVIATTLQSHLMLRAMRLKLP